MSVSPFGVSEFIPLTDDSYAALRFGDWVRYNGAHYYPSAPRPSSDKGVVLYCDDKALIVRWEDGKLTSPNAPCGEAAYYPHSQLVLPL